MRVPDDSIVTADNKEVKADEEIDEFSKYFSGNSTPKVIITTKKKPTSKLVEFCQEFIGVIPNLEFYERRDYHVKEIIEMANKREYTDLVIFNERNRKPEGMWLIHLPDGPTAHFKITSTWTRKEIPNHGNPTGYNPELIMKDFDTRLGQRIGRMLEALFPQKPEFRGRCVVTFKNQRDFVFFRHHRYIFKNEGKNVALQEVGPRMTLKLRSMQQGAFESDNPQFEFMYQPHMQVSRKKFFI